MSGEEGQKDKGETSSRLNLNSRFWRAFLIVLAVFLIFAGPTYVFGVLEGVIEINYFASLISGFALLIVGLVLMWYLIKKNVLT